MARLQQDFADDRTVRLVSISVDPEHNTPEVLQNSAQHFGADPERWLFLTGDKTATYRLAQEGFRLSVVDPGTVPSQVPEASPQGAPSGSRSELQSSSREARRLAPGPFETLGQWVFVPRLAWAHGGVEHTTVLHSARFVLVDRQARIRGYYHSDEEAALQRLRRDMRTVALFGPLDRLVQRSMGGGCDMMGGGSGRPSPEERGAQPPTSSSETARVATGQQVYEANCAVCHGRRGDGQGMAAHMFATQPRDFRSAVFKFRSTPSGSLPRDADLLRVLQRGVRRTAMMAQTHLSDAEQRAVIAYLKTFSSRWQQEEPAPPVLIPEPPPRTPARPAQGRQLYEQAGCAQCHGPAGRGDGPHATALTDDWGWPIQPANLQQRPLKSGTTLQDIYRTLATGLDGTPMPAVGEALPAEELWALVYYIDSLALPWAPADEETLVGEEAHGRMVERMHEMMGGMGGGMPMMQRMMRRQSPQE